MKLKPCINVVEMSLPVFRSCGRFVLLAAGGESGRVKKEYFVFLRNEGKKIVRSQHFFFICFSKNLSGQNLIFLGKYSFFFFFFFFFCFVFFFFLQRHKNEA